ncbi:MAG: hypothetical protein HY553_11860 [Elusimicrobia bacterium]|nr:hypothetical protein [Elusimicrobiota bacterium]
MSLPSAIQAAIVTAWLCAPAFAANPETGRGSGLPGGSTAQVQEKTGDEARPADRYDDWREDRATMDSDGRIREAPAGAPGQTVPRGGVAPGQQQPYRGAPGDLRPGEPGTPGGREATAGAPEAGRRWGLIVFVIAVVALGLMAFRRRGTPPPNP